MHSRQSSQLTFFGIGVLLFGCSAALTVHWCGSDSTMGGMPMPGGWTMSMAYMRRPGQTWVGAGASFLIMWHVMMVAMMMPSLFPALWRFRELMDGTDQTTRDRLTALVGIGYFFVWAVVGVAAFSAGIVVTAIEMQQPVVARLVPAAIGAVVLIAGALQFTNWKARQLACFRESRRGAEMSPLNALTAWRHGLRLGIHCARCSAGLTVILLVLGVMDLWTMAVVTSGITIERFAPTGDYAARIIGVVALGTGMVLIAHGVRAAL